MSSSTGPARAPLASLCKGLHFERQILEKYKGIQLDECEFIAVDPGIRRPVSTWNLSQDAPGFEISQGLYKRQVGRDGPRPITAKKKRELQEYHDSLKGLPSC